MVIMLRLLLGLMFILAASFVDCQQSFAQSYGTASRRVAAYPQAHHQPAPYYSRQVAQPQAVPQPMQPQWAQTAPAGAMPMQMQVAQAPKSTWQQVPPPGYQPAPQQVQYISPPQQPQAWSPQQQQQPTLMAGQVPGTYAQMPVQMQPWQQPQAAQPGALQPGPNGGYNVQSSSVVVEPAPPPKVIFMPPEVVYGPPPKDLMEQQRETGKTVLMCKGTSHTISGDQQFYSCCGEKLYYWKTEKCVDGLIKTAADVENESSKSSSGTSSVTDINCNGSHFPVSTAERNHYSCCGRTLYDTRSSTCNIDGGSTTTVAPSLASSRNVQCPLNFLCCDGYTPIPNADGRYQCCPGAGPYDTTTQQCVPV